MDITEKTKIFKAQNIGKRRSPDTKGCFPQYDAAVRFPKDSREIVYCIYSYYKCLYLYLLIYNGLDINRALWRCPAPYSKILYGYSRRRPIALRLKTKGARRRLVYLVGVRGFEPPTPASRRQCSTRLSYTPTVARGLYGVALFCKRLLAGCVVFQGCL